MNFTTLEKEYDEFTSGMNNFEDVAKAIDKLSDPAKKEVFYALLANELLLLMRGRWIKWGNVNFEEYFPAALFCRVVKNMNKTYTYYWGIYYFFQGDYKQAFKYLKENFEAAYTDAKIEEMEFINDYFGIFYELFPEFWDKFSLLLNEKNACAGIKELCQTIPKFYSATNNDDKVTVLQEFLSKFPKYVLPKELLARTYSDMAMWNNSIALFEQVEDKTGLLPTQDFSFWLAWAYGKVKSYKLEEKKYRECLEVNPDYDFALNNLGYSLYRQGKYEEALEIFKQGMKEKKNLPYPVNNYVRTLLRMGRNVEAKEFVANTKFKVAKDLQRRAEKAPAVDKVLTEKELPSIEIEEEATGGHNVFADVKKEQFSNEKLLEDELTSRIEKGIKTFGLDLKIYKRKGEYGRQYMIPVGRVDLLCEDKEKNLYVIELKKDSGYSDAYAQTAAYLDWFEQQEKFKGRSIYGIICLNTPTEELLKQVHRDKRMRVFEYQVSYCER